MAGDSEETKDPEKEVIQRALDAFDLTRARAINGYAEYEHHLGMLFQQLLGAEMQKSFAVFSSILNTQARGKLIFKLLNLSHGGDYDVFFESLLEKLSGLDPLRAKIAHWVVLVSRTGGEPFDTKKGVCLHRHPDLFAEDRMYKWDVEDFTRKADFYRLLVLSFYLHLKGSPDPGDPSKTPWREIFQNKVTYPPDSNHQLHRFLKKV